MSEVKFVESYDEGSNVFVLLSDRDGKLKGSSSILSKGLKERLEKRLEDSDFDSDKCQDIVLYVGDIDDENVRFQWLVVIKEPKSLSGKSSKELGSKLFLKVMGLKKRDMKEVTVHFHVGLVEKEQYDFILGLALGFSLRSYDFDKYRKDFEDDETRNPLVGLVLSGASYDDLSDEWFEYEAIEEGVNFTRDLVSEPPNVLYPESFADRLKELEELGLEVEVKGEKELVSEGWGALLGVSQGSARDARVVIMRWNGGAEGEKPLAFVGKGVTFDTGGISIKPSGGMEEMKFDMGGAGTVSGLMKCLALRKAGVNVVGAVGLVENMPGGNAIRPSDILTSLSGKTVEVLNTDAEGRLVLADVLWHVKEEYGPKFIVDLATLTGAIMVALGTLYAGLFSNDDDLAESLEEASKETGERIWRMPLDSEFAEELKSPVADMQNIGKRWGGAITAAQFLEKFVGDTAWAHLDIAGVAWDKNGKSYVGKGASGFGVILLNALVKNNE